LFQISAAARRVFDLAADPAPIAQVFRSDALLAPLVKARPGLRIPGAWDPFECSVRALLGQQVTVAGARTLAARIVARVGQPIAEGGDGLTHLFPTPAILANSNLDGLGITGARIAALHSLSRAVVAGTLDFSVGEEDVIKALVSLPGFGLWTAQYIALRGLGQPDAFPTGDLVLRQMAADDDTPLSTRELETRAEAWRPWRGYAVMHLWGAASAHRAAKAAKAKKSAMGKSARAAAPTVSPSPRSQSPLLLPGQRQPKLQDAG
jgi:AraC family transcriptional regulator of adaptative response / DNA-3-methyladenine glycosylase II